MQTPAPDRLYFPTPHNAAVALVDPATHAYPALQLPLQEGDARAGVAPNVPAGQFRQVAPSRVYFPTEQLEDVGDTEPAAQVYPAVQLPLHAAVVRPGISPYVPAGHSVQLVEPAVEY